MLSLMGYVTTVFTRLGGNNVVSFNAFPLVSVFPS